MGWTVKRVASNAVGDSIADRSVEE